MKYTCIKCNKIFNQKIHYTNHLNRKFPCNNTINEDKVIENNNIQNITVIPPESAKVTPELTEIPTKPAKNQPEIKLEKNQCKYCYKIFARCDNLNKHFILNRCKTKQILDEQKENKEKIIDFLLLDEKINKIKEELESNYKNKIEDLEKTVFKLQSKLIKVNTKNINKGNITNNNAKNINNNTNNGTVNNITVVKFGEEDYNKLNTEEILTIINKGTYAIQEAIKMMHFNPRLPEYHNMYISDRKMNKALAFNGEQFSLVNTNDLLNNLIENKLDIIDKIKDKSGYSEDQLNNIIVLIDKLNDDTSDPNVKELYKKIKEDIKNILYNRKKIVLETHEKLIKNNNNEVITI